MLWEQGLEVRRGQVLTPWQQTLWQQRPSEPAPSEPLSSANSHQCPALVLGLHAGTCRVPTSAPPLTHAETQTMGIAAVKQGGDQALQDDFILPVLNLKPSPAKSNSSTITLGVFFYVTCRTLFTSSCYQACQDTALCQGSSLLQSPQFPNFPSLLMPTDRIQGEGRSASTSLLV